MKRVDISEKTKAFNTCREQNLGKAFFYEDIQKVLKDAGIPILIFHIMNKHNTFDKVSEEDGSRTLYSFKKDPIHTSFMERIYREKREQVKGRKITVQSKPVISQEDAWDTLVQAGIIKPKFNINILKARYPKIYLECMEYELNPGK